MMVGRYNGSLLRLARAYVPNDAVAEEAVQDTWMGVVRGVDRFEGRSSFKTWLFRILVDRARSAGTRETSRPFPERRRDVRGPVTLRRHRRVGANRLSRGPTPTTGWWPAPGPSASAPRAVETCPHGSGRSSSSATSRVWPATTCATCSASARGTNASSCTGVAAGSGPCSRTSLHEGAMNVLLRRERIWCASRWWSWSPTTWRATCRGRTGGGSSPICATVPTAPTTSSRCRATIRATGALHPDDLSPEVQRQFTELFRQWRDEGAAS